MYPEVFALEVERDLSFRILIQINHRNQKQDLEISLWMTNKAIKEMAAMYSTQSEVLGNLLPRSLLVAEENKNTEKIEEVEIAEIINDTKLS